METETNLVFVCTRTGTIDGIDSSARVVDLDACGFVPDGDDYIDDTDVMELAGSHGVPVSDLWAAYQREQERAGNGWRFDGDAWHHCDRPAHWDGDDVVCSRCQETMPDDDTAGES